MNAGVPKSKRFSWVSVTAFTSLGSIDWKKPAFVGLGNVSPSQNSESMAVKCGNPKWGSRSDISSWGSSACITDFRAFAENVTCFTFENASSLGTYTLLLLCSDCQNNEESQSFSYWWSYVVATVLYLIQSQIT